MEETACQGTSTCQVVSLGRLLWRWTILRFLTGYHYLATLTAGIYAEPMLTLVQQTRTAIADLARQAQNGGHAPKRFQSPSKPHAVKRAARASHQLI